MTNPHARWRAGVVAGSLGVALGCGAGTPSEPRVPSSAPSFAEASQRTSTRAEAPTAPAAPDATNQALTRKAGELGPDDSSDPHSTPADDSAYRAKLEASQVEAECNALCASAAETCSRKSARECRANCGKYQALSDRCEVQVLGAIRCQAAIPKFVCSNLASECTTEFRALSECERGDASAEAAATSNAPALPSGWAPVRDREAGFEVALPLGARVADLDGRRTWTGEGPDGASYRVVVLPALQGPATEKRLMETLLHYLGHDCQPAVRLHGRFETNRDVAERFNARCEDGQRWRGLMRASREHLVLIVEVLPPGVPAVGDAYYYSFEYLN